MLLLLAMLLVAVGSFTYPQHPVFLCGRQSTLSWFKHLEWHKQNGAYPRIHPSTSRRGNIMMLAAPDGLNWFVKTEQFCKPYPQVKPHLEAHREWVRSMREENAICVSGYRVDKNDRPGGGGLMIFAARDYNAAEAFVKNDPLVQNECVDYQLNKWIPETGDIALE